MIVFDVACGVLEKRMQQFDAAPRQGFLMQQLFLSATNEYESECVRLTNHSLSSVPDGWVGRLGGLKLPGW